MSKVTLAEAEKAADRYLAAQLELKKQKEEEKSSLKLLRQYCTENPETTVIGKCLAYSKSFAPKLNGPKAAIEAVVKKLRKVYSIWTPNAKEIPAHDEVMQVLNEHDLLVKSADVALMAESLVKDQKLVALLEANGVSIDSKTEMYFKHI